MTDRSQVWRCCQKYSNPTSLEVILNQWFPWILSGGENDMSHNLFVSGDKDDGAYDNLCDDNDGANDVDEKDDDNGDADNNARPPPTGQAAPGRGSCT